MRGKVLLALLGLVLADTACWLTGTWALQRQAARWAIQAQTHGWSISSGTQTKGGWPFAASLTIDRLGVSGGARALPGGLAWSAQRVVAWVSIVHPFTLNVAAEGQQFLRLAHAPDLAFTAATAVARVPLGAVRHGRGTLEAAGISGGIAGSRHPQDVQVAALHLALRADQDESGSAPARLTVRLEVRARDVGLPDIGRWPLGAIIADAGGTVVLTSPLQPDKPDTTGHAGVQALAWRDGGGHVSLQDGQLRWGPLAVRVAAELQLDGKLQPSGTGTAEMSGTTPALDAAAGAGLIAPGLASTAKAVLAFMTHVDGPDGDAVRLPFQLHDRTVSVGRIPVARVPEITW